MDALQQQHQRFMRPPMSDPQQQQQQRQLQGPPPPWYSSSPHFQYQPSPQWAPPPPPLSSDPHHQLHHPLPPHPHHHHQQQQLQPMPSAYPAPPPAPPYPSPHPQHPAHHYSPSHLPPSHMPHAPPFSQPSQTWGNPNWSRQQGWEYQDRNGPLSNDEDWAARARAWAAAKATLENQQAPSQFTHVGRMEEHSHVYHDQYHQVADSHFTDVQKSPLVPSSHQQFPVSVTSSHRSSTEHLQEPLCFSSGSSSFYVPDGTTSASYGARDGALTADSNPITPQGNGLASSSIYQQEVPSSYSPIPGNVEARNQNEQFLRPSASSLSLHQEQLNPPPNLPAVGRSVPVERSHFMQGDQSVEAIFDVKDRNSDYDQFSDHDHDSRHQTNFIHHNSAGPLGGADQIATVSSVHAWTPARAPAGPFPSIPPFPSGSQFDPAFLSPSIPGHPASGFGGLPGPGFRPSIPPVGAPFGLGAGTAVHPTSDFTGDANGGFNVSERPKKASVPNWLREEIIKKKAVIASSSAQDHAAEDSFHSLGLESDDKSLGKGDQADSKSADSIKSTEDEEDDEDEVEAARSAAINLEIKRILTEVLLKVTDELFDEIATKVLNEDDMMVEVDNSSDAVRHKEPPSPPAVPTPKASAKVLIPVKAKSLEVDDASEKSDSSSPGDVLGLSNYASDEEEEIQSSGIHSGQTNGGTYEQPNNDRTSEDEHNAETGIKQTEVKESNEALTDNCSMSNGESDMRRKGFGHADKESVFGNDVAPIATGRVPVVHEDKTVEGRNMVEFSQGRTDDIESKDITVEKASVKCESELGDAIPLKSVNEESKVRESRREARSKSEKNVGFEVKKSSVNKVPVKEVHTSVKVKTSEKYSDSAEPRRGEDRDVAKEQRDERNTSSRERIKDHNLKPVEKLRDSDARKLSSHGNSKEDRKDPEKAKRVSAKGDGNRNRERARNDKEDRSRQRDSRDSRRYKRQRSSSVSSRGKNSRDNSLIGNLSGSSDETSENSKQRKLQTNKRSLSPSPVRSRRRQVSRSPHSKHSQRRHSPYSSTETRGRRSRSRSGSPIRRRR